MKIDDLNEMTLKMGKIDRESEKIANLNMEYWKTGEYVGDIENIKVFLYRSTEKNFVYSLWTNDKFVGYCLMIMDNPANLEQVWISPLFRKQKIFSKLLWFLKTREGYNPILLGDIQSSEMIEVLKNLSRFQKTWISDSEQILYDPETINQFYGINKKTKWRLLLENDGDFKDWPKFFTGYMVKDFYDWQIE